MNQFIRPPATSVIHVNAGFSGRRQSSSQLRSLGKACASVLMFVSILLVVAVIVAACYLLQRGGATVADTGVQSESISNINGVTESHGDSFEEVIANIRNEPYEIFVAFDSHGTKLFEYSDNNCNSVKIPPQLLNYYQEHNGTYILHNHPAEHTPFSLEDLETACSLEVSATIVSTYSCNYFLEPTTDGWPQPGELFDWEREHHSNIPDDEYWEMVTLTDPQTGIVYNGLGTTEKLIQQFAEAFNLRFYKTEPSAPLNVAKSEISAPQ